MLTTSLRNTERQGFPLHRENALNKLELMFDYRQTSAAVLATVPPIHQNKAVFLYPGFHDDGVGRKT